MKAKSQREEEEEDVKEEEEKEEERGKNSTIQLEMIGNEVVAAVTKPLNAFRPLASFRRSISFAFHLARSFVCRTPSYPNPEAAKR